MSEEFGSKNVAAVLLGERIMLNTFFRTYDGDIQNERKLEGNLPCDDEKITPKKCKGNVRGSFNMRWW